MRSKVRKISYSYAQSKHSRTTAYIPYASECAFWTDGRTDRQADRQTDRQTDRHGGRRENLGYITLEKAALFSRQVFSRCLRIPSLRAI